MKQFILIVSFLVIGTVFALKASHQQDNGLLGKVVAQLDSARTNADWKKARSHFERIASGEPNEWLPLYYLAYIDIELSFRVEDKREKLQYLEEAEVYLEKLRKIKRTDPKELSEISVIRGYWYFAQMAINPATNGPKYAGVINECYSVALKLCPDNPRALLLNAWYQQNMASFMRGNYAQYEEDITKAAMLFGKEDKSGVLPHWEKKIVSQ